jgi:hypothetical protein
MTAPRQGGPEQFPEAAAGALAPVAGRVEQAKQSAQSGDVYIDREAARDIIHRINALHRRAKALQQESGELDVPLKFGENWVGGLMAQRFTRAAGHSDTGITTVLGTFSQVLWDLEATVRLAADLYARGDEEAVVQLHKAAERLSMKIEGADA